MFGYKAIKIIGMQGNGGETKGLEMKRVEVTEYRDGMAKKSFKIAEEAVLHVEINDMSYDVIISPSEIREFIYGNLLSEGFIKKEEEVLSYIVKKRKDLINVRLRISHFEPSFLRKNYNIVWTECGSVPEIQKRKGERLRKVHCDFNLRARDILTLQGSMKVKINLLEKTGGVHFSGLFSRDLELKHFSHDIGRHNAVDKVVGKNLLAGEGFDDKMLFTTGRISSDIVVKCLRVGIPVVVSKNSPLYTAITLARKYNLCLIGYLRGKRFDIFSGEDVVKE